MQGLSGLILCGGRSTRMGVDKALIEVGGRTLLEIVAARLDSVCDEVLVAPGSAGRLGHIGYREISDASAPPGPLGGIVAGLRESKSDLMAVVAVDMPNCDPALFAALAELASSAPAVHAVIPRDGSGLQPLHAVYRRTALPVLEAGEGKVSDAVLALDPVIVEGDDLAALTQDADFATNVNRPQDLRLL